MLHNVQTQATLIFFSDMDLNVQYETHLLNHNDSGRLIVPDELKQGRSILAVCEGKVNILNKLGDRTLPLGLPSDDILDNAAR